MNSNFYWQSLGFNFDIEHQTYTFVNNFTLQPFEDIHCEVSLDELKKKCETLVTENSKLKEQISLLKTKKIKRKKKRVKRRKEEELDKKFKCSFPQCKKDYASLLALNLHIKKKHPYHSTSTFASIKSDQEEKEFEFKEEKEFGSSS